MATLGGVNPFGAKKSLMRKMIRNIRPAKLSTGKARLAGAPKKAPKMPSNPKGLTGALNMGSARGSKSVLGGGIGKFPSGTGGVLPGSLGGDGITGGAGSNLGTNGIF